jgi:hypothetical protein
MHVLLALFCFATAQQGFPTPPVQTDVQKFVFQTKSLQARAASEAATPEVVAFFESKEFRAAIKECCADLLAHSGKEILERFRAEARVAELAHAFPAELEKSESGVPINLDLVDVTITDLQNRSWFMNEWQAKLLSGASLDMGPQNVVEQEVFGLPDFKHRVPSWEEASDRLIYTAHNLHQIDTGSMPTYGDITAIFSNSYVQNMTLISPDDTGFQDLACRNEHASLPMHLFNCTSWKPQVVGTLDAFDHLILPNLAAVKYESLAHAAKLLFQRSALNSKGYLGLARIWWLGMGRYWEANILGNPRLPEGVRFLIGNFGAIFGTVDGERLQELCRSRGWPLVWALGTYNRGVVTTTLLLPTGNERLLDPQIASSTNATLAAGASDQFAKIWSEVKTSRELVKNVPTPVLAAFWHRLKSVQTRVAPLSSSSCEDVENCIGTETASGRCVCKTLQEATMTLV